jgi:hypothetical protein
MTPSGVVRETGTIVFKSFATERRERLATRTYLKIADCCRSDINVE